MSVIAKRGLATAVWIAIVLGAATASAEPECPELPCSIIRNCSSTGIACEPDDRECTERARVQSLEVKCEQHCVHSTKLVYCPPETGRSDSKVVWILLGLAFALATIGSTVAWLVLRKKGA